MKEPLLSVVVPALNESRRIGGVIDRILDGSGLASVELIVVDGGSTDDTVAIASRRAKVLAGPRGRARQMNAGVRRTRGEVLLFCHADTLLPEGYGRAVQRALEDPKVVGGAFRHRWDADEPLLRLLEIAVSLPFAFTMFGDQGMFVRRSALEAIGLFPDIPLMEDVYLAQALKRRGRLVRLRPRVLTSARRFQERGVLRQILLDLRLYLAFRLGADPARLARRYHVTERDAAVGSDASAERSKVRGSSPALAIFAKAPIPGHAKTRLGRSIGPERAALAYEELLRGFLGAVPGRLPGWRVRLYLAESRDFPWFKAHWPDLPLTAQRGSNLGERMHQAFLDLFQEGHDRVMVVGTDIPELDAETIQRAAALLREARVVIGPTHDGGYYLLGMRSPGWDLFSGIEWDAAGVFEGTLDRATKNGLEVARLPTLHDVDTLEDWNRYRRSGARSTSGEKP